MKTYILLNLETLKVIALAWDCFSEIEYYAAYDPDPVNTLLTMCTIKPVEYLIEYLPQFKDRFARQSKNLIKDRSEDLIEEWDKELISSGEQNNVA